MSRKNSGADQTILVCDGAETFYSGDGHSDYRREPRVTPQCDFPLSKFYEFDNDPATTSVVVRDHDHLAEGDRERVLVRATLKHATGHTGRTMGNATVSVLS